MEYTIDKILKEIEEYQDKAEQISAYKVLVKMLDRENQILKQIKGVKLKERPSVELPPLPPLPKINKQ